MFLFGLGLLVGLVSYPLVQTLYPDLKNLYGAVSSVQAHNKLYHTLEMAWKIFMIRMEQYWNFSCVRLDPHRYVITYWIQGRMYKIIARPISIPLYDDDSAEPYALGYQSIKEFYNQNSNVRVQ